MSEEAKVEAGRRSIEISHPDKVLFEQGGADKRALAGYYAEVAEWMAPHLDERPIHVSAYPDGIDGEDFVRKSVPDHYPEWIERATLAKREGGEITQVVSPGAATLAYLAGQNAIEIHGWLSLLDRPDDPDQLIIDLDPTGEDFGEVREAARITREAFDELELPAYLKLTGSRGVHVVAPLDRSAGFDRVRELARGIAELCASRDQELLTVETRKEKRRGRLFVDWLRNGYAQTAVVPYSVRARPGAPVSMPITWDELGEVGPREYTIETALDRLRGGADPWSDMRSRAHGSETALKRLRARS